MKIEQSDLLALENLSRALSKARFDDFTIEEMQAVLQCGKRLNALRQRMHEELNKPKPQSKKKTKTKKVAKRGTG